MCWEKAMCWDKGERGDQLEATLIVLECSQKVEVEE